MAETYPWAWGWHWQQWFWSWPCMIPEMGRYSMCALQSQGMFCGSGGFPSSFGSFHPFWIWQVLTGGESTGRASSKGKFENHWHLPRMSQPQRVCPQSQAEAVCLSPHSQHCYRGLGPVSIDAQVAGSGSHTLPLALRCGLSLCPARAWSDAEGAKVGYVFDMVWFIYILFSDPKAPAG